MPISTRQRPPRPGSGPGRPRRLRDRQPRSTARKPITTARLCLMDALGCAMAALAFPACTKLLGPVVPGTVVPNGARVPGTPYQLDPVTAAFNLGAMIRWLDYNDTWLAAEWGHPSDNLGGILMTADWLSRQAASRQGRPPLAMRDVLTALIQAYEIQGVLALENSFNRVGLDHVLLVKVASTAVAARLLGGSREQIINAALQRLDRRAGAAHLPPRAQHRLAQILGGRRRHQPRGAPGADGAEGRDGLSLRADAPKPGAFTTCCSKASPSGSAGRSARYVMENILFKVSFPAEFHAQTAVEAAIQLHPQVKDRLDEIERVVITTQESAMRIIDKSGPLYNPADRDHCIQYMTAIGLIFGDLTAEHYEDAAAADPRIDALRAKMVCVEDPQYSRDYLDPAKRSIANAVQVFFNDGTRTPIVEVEYPIGHRRRRQEAIPLLEDKFRENLASHFEAPQVDTIMNRFRDPERLDNSPVHEMVDLFVMK